MEEEARELVRSARTSSSPIRGSLAERFTDDLQRLAASNLSCRDTTLSAWSRNLANDHPRYQCALGAYEAQALFSSCGMGCQTTSNRTFYNINHRGGNLLLLQSHHPIPPRAT